MTIHQKLKHEKRNIEWSQLSWNWMSGCDGIDGEHCEGCYAKCIATMRLKGRYGYPKEDPFKVVLHPDKLFGHAPETLPDWTKRQSPGGRYPLISGPFKRWVKHPLVRKVPTVYFNVSMGDWMFAEPDWRREALKIMRDCPHHIFVTLTKQYERLSFLKWTPMLKNVIIGISVTNREQAQATHSAYTDTVSGSIDKLRKVDAFTRLVCFEPLLEDVADLVDLTGIHWIIIGKRTKQIGTPEFMPEKEWVDKLIAMAREQDIPVFLKPSMTAPAGWEMIQETPYERIREATRVKTLKEYQDHMDGAIKKAMIPPPPRGRMCGSDGIY